MKKFITICLVLMCYPVTASAAGQWAGWYIGPWEAWYNGMSGKAVVEQTDGALGVAGSLNSCENYSFCQYGFLATFNSRGKLTRGLMFGKDESPNTELTHLVATADGGLAAVGYTQAGGIGLTDLFVVKLSPTGNPVWQRAIGHESYQEYGQRIYENADGSLTVIGVVVQPGCHECGCGYHNLHAYDLDGASGVLLGEKKLTGGGLGTEYIGYKVSDGGFLVLPVTFYSGIDYTVTLQKLYPSGTLEWSRAYFALDAEARMVGLNSRYSAVEVADGYLVNVLAGSNGYMYRFKVDFLGMVQWMVRIDLYPDTTEWPTSPLAATAGGGGIVSVTNGYSTVENVLVETQGDGQDGWAKKYHGPVASGQFNWLTQAADGGYLATGNQGWLQLAHLGASGELSGICDQLAVTDQDLVITNVTWSESGGIEPAWCDYQAATEREVSLVYPGGLIDKILCGAKPPETTPTNILLLMD